MTDQPRHAEIPEIINLGEIGSCASRGQTSVPSTSWKFVLIKKDSRIHLVIGPVNLFRYHANLVDTFCRCYEIPASKARGTQRVEIYDRSVRVLGGGQATVNPESRSVRFYGQSTAYGQYDTDAVKAILQRSSLFAGFSVLVN